MTPRVRVCLMLCVLASGDLRAVAQEIAEQKPILKFGYLPVSNQSCEQWRSAPAKLRLENFPAILVPLDLLEPDPAVAQPMDKGVIGVKLRRAGDTTYYEVPDSEYEGSSETRPVAGTQPILVRRAGQTITSKDAPSVVGKSERPIFDPEDESSWKNADELIYPRGHMTIELDACVTRFGLDDLSIKSAKWTLTQTSGSPLAGTIELPEGYESIMMSWPEGRISGKERFSLTGLSVSTATGSGDPTENSYLAYGFSVIEVIDWDFTSEKAVP